ncbi:hypothetical protein F2Q69_00008234 [Brassica cretica]|uniref:Uncharacterized protein n=1 Tax=Brassica cretica TaxID=69181 RepID=A0A8S9PA88_BRACR|nr:hypothetical protein F2Q69_00008234 [Brassica cretica]
MNTLIPIASRSYAFPISNPAFPSQLQTISAQTNSASALDPGHLAFQTASVPFASEPLAIRQQQLPFNDQPLAISASICSRPARVPFLSSLRFILWWSGFNNQLS